MNREIFDIAAGIVERIDKLEKIIFKIQEISHKKNFEIRGFNSIIDNDVNLNDSIFFLSDAIT
jgi:hypothetical protein